MNASIKQRRIVDYRNLSSELLDLLDAKYQGDYSADTIRFRNAQGDLITAVPVETEDTVYLVKTSVQLRRKLEELAAAQEFDSQDDEEDDEDTPLRWEDPELED